MFNLSLYNRFFVLEPPAHLKKIRGHAIECQHFGHMYSFEWMYTDFFTMNPQYLARSAEEADIIVLSHCVTYVYHLLRYGLGFNTPAKTWEALHMVQEEYLLPIVRWAQSTPAHRRSGGRNFALVLAMDKGRMDYPIVSRATAAWHAITTVGNRSFGITRDPRPLLDELGITRVGIADACAHDRGTVKRRLIFFSQDVVVPVPTGFIWKEAAAETDRRDLLVFYAGSPNSCMRRFLARELSDSPDADVLVVPKPLPKDVWSGLVYRSRFCFVPDGYSSISARLYEVLLHGCVPVLFSSAFHPPFETLLDWRRLAVFLRRTEVRDAPAILRAIPQEHYLGMHAAISAAQRLLGPDEIGFWHATNLELGLKRRQRSEEGI